MTFTTKDQNQDHKKFTVLQNILSQIGLTAFERSVYWAIKEYAWENSSCTKSYEKLAKSAGLSISSLQRALKSLAEPNKILGKALIIINHRLTECGDKDTNEIILIDLWMDNELFFKEKISPVTQTPPPVTQTGGVRSHRPEGPVTQTDKEDSYKKTPLKKTNSFVLPANAVGLANQFFKSIQKFKPDFKEPNLTQWASDFEKTMRIDNRSEEALKKIIDWLPTNDFWRKNILSPDKLRKQFDRVEIEMAVSVTSNWIKININFYTYYKKNQPNDMKDIILQNECVLNTQNSKDVSLKIDPVIFEKHFLNLVGGAYV